MVTSSLLPAAPGEPGRAGPCVGCPVPPPASLARGWGFQDFTFGRRAGPGGAGAARALCASRAPPLICGAGTEHRGRLRYQRGPDGGRRMCGAGSGAGVPGEAAPGTGTGATSAPPTGGEGGHGQVCLCRPSGHGIAQRLSGIRTLRWLPKAPLPGVAAIPIGRSSLWLPPAQLSFHTYPCVPALPSQSTATPARSTASADPLPGWPSPHPTQPAHCHHWHKSLNTTLRLQGGGIIHQRMSPKEK